MVDSVAVQVFVRGGVDPADRYQNMFLLQYKPKDLVFPPHPDGGNGVFEVGNCAENVEDLRLRLSVGIDWFNGSENWQYMSDEDIDHYVRVLPAPFNDPNAEVQLTWAASDVVFDAAAQVILDLHDYAYSEVELKKLDCDMLRLICGCKGAFIGGKKAELIESVLVLQKELGQSAVRVVQTSLMEVSA